MPYRTDTRNVKVFISYRNIKLSKHEGEFLADALQRQYGYEVFIDTQKLKDEGGVKWAEAIYDNVRSSDVLVVLLERETAQSEWVQREVDVARGAAVSILPLVIAASEEVERVIGEVQQKLALAEFQYLRFSSAEPDLEPIRKSIERLVKHTRDDQQTWMERRQDQWRLRRAEHDLASYAIYRPRGFDQPCRVHIATGDMTTLRDIDVLVNSENNYMQMARIHEGMVLSSALRREGAWVVGGRMKDDTVQRELDEYIAHSEVFGSRPIEMEQVIPTRAGHPKSKLAQNGAHYIFHAATVYVHPRNRSVTPLSTDDGIRQATLNCLHMALDVDGSLGVISPPGSPRHETEQAAQGDYQPIRSMAFPLFGTGRGGRSVLEVAPPMIRAFRDFLYEQRASPALKLEHIHLVVFSDTDVPFIEEALGKDFARE
jgi:O-acetyl-ADP-ribose deacetylase (regulator of RNase III)